MGAVLLGAILRDLLNASQLAFRGAVDSRGSRCPVRDVAIVRENVILFVKGQAEGPRTGCDPLREKQVTAVSITQDREGEQDGAIRQAPPASGTRAGVITPSSPITPSPMRNALATLSQPRRSPNSGGSREKEPAYQRDKENRGADGGTTMWRPERSGTICQAYGPGNLSCQRGCPANAPPSKRI